MNTTLLGFEDIPIIDPLPKKSVQYYLRVKAGDGWHFLWKTHAQGGPEWAHDFELVNNGGKKKPLRYKTVWGAQYATKRFLNSKDIYEVTIWEGV